MNDDDDDVEDDADKEEKEEGKIRNNPEKNQVRISYYY